MRDRPSTSDEGFPSAERGGHLEEGETFALRYEIRELVGVGGFARVYRAADVEEEREVAIKLHTPDTGEDLEDLSTAEIRFYREARLLSRLESPHTIRVYDYGRTGDGELYMVCEFVDGTDLKALLDIEGPFGEERTRNLLIQILRSLRDAHERSILHRDLKPSNIMVREGAGGGEEVKVLDFGIAKSVAAESERQKGLTAEGVVIGTPTYMSPEQARGQPLRERSDLFSVGLLVFEMLVGGSPYKGRSLRAVRQRMRTGPIRLPNGVDVADDLRRVTNAMLERNLENRIKSARVALEELGAPVEVPSGSANDSGSRRPSGVSYPLGLGGHPGSDYRSVHPSDETRSERIYPPVPPTPSAPEQETPSGATPVEDSEFYVSPTVVDPDVRPPADSEESDPGLDTARMPSDPSSGSETETDERKNSTEGASGRESEPRGERRSVGLVGGMLVATVSVAGVAGAVGFWLASRTSEPEPTPSHSIEQGAETTKRQSGEENAAEASPNPVKPGEVKETLRRARGAVIQGLSSAEGRMQRVRRRRRAERRANTERTTTGGDRRDEQASDDSAAGSGGGAEGSDAPATGGARESNSEREERSSPEVEPVDSAASSAEQSSENSPAIKPIDDYID